MYMCGIFSHFPLTHIFLFYPASFPLFFFIYPSDPLGTFFFLPFIILVDFSTQEALQQNTAMTGCSSSHSSRKKREREIGSHTSQCMCVCVYAVDSIKKGRRV
jgi:hypothetical protein